MGGEGSVVVYCHAGLLGRCKSRGGLQTSSVDVRTCRTLRCSSPKPIVPSHRRSKTRDLWKAAGTAAADLAM
jgi:hypothetical protein